MIFCFCFIGPGPSHSGLKMTDNLVRRNYTDDADSISRLSWRCNFPSRARGFLCTRRGCFITIPSKITYRDGRKLCSRLHEFAPLAECGITQPKTRVFGHQCVLTSSTRNHLPLIPLAFGLRTFPRRDPLFLQGYCALHLQNPILHLQ